MGRKYIQREEGEWITPDMDDYYMCCCDCGLVHRIRFRIVFKAFDGKINIKIPVIQFQVFRDNRATGQFRRHNKIKVTKEYE